MPNVARILLSLVLLSFMSVHAQDEESSQILITNVRIFDGVNEELVQGQVLVEGNLISAVSARARLGAGRDSH